MGVSAIQRLNHQISPTIRSRMDRKYKQRGYRTQVAAANALSANPAKKLESFGPKHRTCPASAKWCDAPPAQDLLPAGIDFTAKCPRCNAELHSCKQCSFFDTASRFECTQPVSARIPKKESRNQCNFYSPRTTIERETSSSRPLDARQAFENLFRKVKVAVVARIKLGNASNAAVGVEPSCRTNCH